MLWGVLDGIGRHSIGESGTTPLARNLEVHLIGAVPAFRVQSRAGHELSNTGLQHKEDPAHWYTTGCVQSTRHTPSLRGCPSRGWNSVTSEICCLVGAPEMGLCIKLGLCVSVLPGGPRAGAVYKTRTGTERTHKSKGWGGTRGVLGPRKETDTH